MPVYRVTFEAFYETEVRAGDEDDAKRTAQEDYQQFRKDLERRNENIWDVKVVEIPDIKGE